MNNENNGMNSVNPMMPNTNPAMPGMTPGAMNPNPMGQAPVMGTTPVTPEPTPVAPTPVTPVTPTPVANPNPVMPGMAGPEVTPAAPVQPTVQAPVTPTAPVTPGPMGTNPVPPTAPMPNANPNMMNNAMPAEAPKKKNSPVSIIVLVVLLIVLAVVIYFRFFKKEETPATPTPTPTDTTPEQPVANANTYSVGGYILTVPEGYTAQKTTSDGAELLEITVPGKYVVELQMNKYLNFSDYDNQETTVDLFRNDLTSAGATVTDAGKMNLGGKEWVVARGTLVTNGTTLYANSGMTECTNGIVVAAIISAQEDMNEIYGVVNTIINTVQDDTSSFAPTENQELKVPSLNGKTL